MTRLFNDPVGFADEMTDGFAAAYARFVRRVPGGVVRQDGTAAGEVAVVIGGGSGHYPAFAGLVGPGLAHGAAMGDLFASPSAARVRSVAQAADGGAGILFCYGNYAGDVLNFTEAQERLRADGVDVRTVLVTDDVSSAPRESRERRRGIAGDLAVFKLAGAAAARGAALDDVERVVRRANDRTRTLGVAFSGCTLPGASEPLFRVPEGRMAVGMGIHGEPGISDDDLPTADELAALFVGRLLGELPDDVSTPADGRVAVILNGLGSVKYEELFVVYRGVARRLAEAGVTTVDPDVGEFCTSFDMAGASLTLTWLDDELEELWLAPADTPAYRKAPTALTRRAGTPAADVTTAQPPAAAEPTLGSEASRAAAATACAVLDAVAAAVADAADELGRLDAVAGDGDHGIGMRRGALAAAEAARPARDRGLGCGQVLAIAGDAWADRGGGTSGALWGTTLRAVGHRLGDVEAPTPGAVAEAVADALAAVRRQGGAALGDKTLVDAFAPFVDGLTRRIADGSSLAAAWLAAAQAATTAADATADLLPRLGRARPHAERSLGTPDPGARSFAIAMTAAALCLTQLEEEA
ncbi:dihydroxyacetone kinase family protein [Dactylosporangium sp. CA-233914]|uniref:dihydroxyacetone kinase family protein n=1 Tax=Dactylosporangium sp. CA-233914 TaxID=3239934 RepID=UPI003D8E1572